MRVVRIVVKVWHACVHGLMWYGYQISVTQGYAPPVTADEHRYYHWLKDHAS